MEYIRVMMTRPDMNGIPQYALPAGYSLRFFRPGDDANWVRIWKAAEDATGFSQIDQDTFDKDFGQDLPGMARRCYFLLDSSGREIGTATAWYDHKYAGKPWGRVHWVAILPECQGKGLCKPMLSAVMNRMKALGHRRALLATQTPRLPAIKTYLDYGFVPDLTAPDAARAWALVREALPHPALAKI